MEDGKKIKIVGELEDKGSGIKLEGVTAHKLRKIRQAMNESHDMNLTLPQVLSHIITKHYKSLEL